jgi:hypothetical protein
MSGMSQFFSTIGVGCVLLVAVSGSAAAALMV